MSIPVPGGSPGSAGGPVSFVHTVPPLEVVKPPQGIDFTPSGSIAGATSGTTPAVVGLCTLDVPLGSVAMLRSFVLQVVGLLPTSAISFSVRDNGEPVSGMAQLAVPAANLAVYSTSWGPDEVFIRVGPGHVLSIWCTVAAADGGTYSVFASMHGWFVPLELVQQFDQAWG